MNRSQSLFGASSTGAGGSVALPFVTDRFSLQVTLTGSTKCSVRLQGSLNGSNWMNLTAAASTFTSTQAAIIRNTTSSVLVRLVRLTLVSKSSTSATDVNGWIAGKGA